jgi:hypothetical protein
VYDCGNPLGNDAAEGWMMASGYGGSKGMEGH